MQAALPLSRSVRNAVTTSTSRIPHLEYHIARKLDRHGTSNHKARSSRNQQQLRHRSYVADASLAFPAWSSSTFDLPLDGQDADAKHTDGSARKSVSRKFSPMSRKVDFIANQIVQQSFSETTGFLDLGLSTQDISVSKLLAEASPERLLAWLISHPTGQAFIGVATKEEFGRAFCALDPSIFVDPYKQAQRHLREGQRNSDRELHFDRSLVQRLRQFASQIDTILVRRQEAGLPLTLDVCRHALKCAASVGDVRMANHFWDKVMPTNMIEPDLQCYNSYLHAQIWNLAHSEISRMSFRNTSRNLELRSKAWRPKNLLGYRVNPNSQMQEPDWALKARVLAMFKDISNKGLVTNEETFTNLMIGLARGGDLPGVDSILKSVWNVDVNALGNFDEEELESPTYYAETHPLRPTDKLLFAIVHSYAVNSSAAKAWTILDYTSRNYALDIPEYVWNELFEWTFVLSLPRTWVQQQQGQAAGKIPTAELESLFNIMVDAPHNVKPNATVLNMLAKNYRRRRHLDKSLDTVRRAQKDLFRDLEQLRLMVDTIKAITKDLRGITDNGILSHKFLDFRRDFQAAFLAARQQYDYLMLETKRILKEDDWAGSGRQQTWQRQRLPQVIEEFGAYLPNYCEYKTKTGHVNLYLTKHRGQASEDGPIRTLLFEATRVWQAFEPNDLFELAENLKALPDDLEG